MDWLDALQHLRGEGTAGVLITVIEVRGHAPREAGAKMVVSESGTWDTVGGGMTGKSSGIVRCHYGVSSLAAMAAVGLEVFEDFADIAEVELLRIDADTKLRDFQRELRWNAAYYRLAQKL